MRLELTERQKAQAVLLPHLLPVYASEFRGRKPNLNMKELREALHGTYETWAEEFILRR